ncbi:hypothetical protein ACTXT7_000643 [Hymenolepis weldensis]
MSRRRSLGVMIDTRLGIYVQIDKHTAEPSMDTTHMNPGDTPRRQLLRQEEQEEGTSAHRPEELEEESMDTSKSSIITTSATASSQRPHIMTSSNSTSTSTSTTNTTSSSSSATKHCEMRLKHRQILQVGDGGGSTTSSSTEDSEARERRFGSIDLQQPLPLKTAPSTSVTGADLTKGQSPIDAQLKQALLADFNPNMAILNQMGDNYHCVIKSIKSNSRIEDTK